MTDGAPPAVPPGLIPGGRYDVWRPAPPAYVVADVDGTLVGPEPVASEEVTAAVTRAQEHGIRVGFATGRMRLAVGPLYQQLRAHGPHVLHNGAEVRSDGATIASWPLSRHHLDAVFAIVDDLDAYAEIYLADHYLVTSFDERARAHWDLLGQQPVGRATSPDDVVGDVLKVTFGVFDDDTYLPVVDALVDAGLAAGPAGSPLTPSIMYVNATDPHVDKGRALAAAAGHLGVGMHAVVAIGDAHNDLSMLAIAGTAVAMGQADADVHAGAHLIAPHVDDHGVATVLAACVAGFTR